MLLNDHTAVESRKDVDAGDILTRFIFYAFMGILFQKASPNFVSDRVNTQHSGINRFLIS